jgi:hypothetical protein
MLGQGSEKIWGGCAADQGLRSRGGWVVLGLVLTPLTTLTPSKKTFSGLNSDLTPLTTLTPSKKTFSG